jgi:hypothetical protein
MVDDLLIDAPDEPQDVVGSGEHEQRGHQDDADFQADFLHPLA